MENGQGIGRGEVNSTGNSEQEIHEFAKTTQFIETAVGEGAHLQMPFYITRRGTHVKISEEQWVRQKNIVGIYFGTPATLDEIGRQYGISSERVRQIVEKGIMYLWRNCSPETQTLFPLQDIVLHKRKPVTQRSRERMSQARGGIPLLLRDQVKSGKSYGEIRKSGLSIEQIASARRVLQKWGINGLPYENTTRYTTHSQNIELEKKLRKVEDDEEKQELLNQVKLGFHQKHSKGENPLFTHLGGIVSETGFRLGWNLQNYHFFIESLENVRFPMVNLSREYKSKHGEKKILTYHVLLAKDRERARQILLADPALQIFRDS